ncbi:sodium- and chloride-dependent GABA transporter 1-like [Amblyomma americanum]
MKAGEQPEPERASPYISPQANALSPVPESKRGRHRKHHDRTPATAAKQEEVATSSVAPNSEGAPPQQPQRHSRQPRDDPEQLDDDEVPEEASMLKNVRHVWADEAAAARGGADEAAPRISFTIQEVPSSEFWRPPLLTQTAPSPKTTSDSRYHCNPRDTLLVSFGFCLGVSGFWRFPALVAEHGGIGYVSVWYCFLLAVCHSLRVTYSVFYLFDGVYQAVPWSNCRDAWSADCYSTGTEFLRCKYVNMPSQPTVNGSASSSYVMEVTQQNAVYCINASRTASEAYFMDFVLQLSSGIHNPGDVRLQLLIPMTAVWIVVLLICTQAPHIINGVYRVLCWVGMLCFLPFMAESVYHHYTLAGLVTSLTPDLAALTSRRIWLDAAEHSLLSLGTSSGIIFYLGSRCKYGYCYERCAAWTVVAEVTACDLIAMTTCLWIHKPGNTEEEISPAVPFNFRQLVTTAQLVVPCVYPAMCNALVFTSFITMSLMANVLLVKTCVMDIAAVLCSATRRAEAWTLCVVCALAYACSVPLCTQGGLYIHHILEQGLARNLFFVVALAQVMCLAWFYGVPRLSFDLEYMLKDPVGVYWIYCWAFTVPVALLVTAALYVSDGASSASLVIGDYTYPHWASMFVWLSSAVSLLPVPVMAVRHWIDVDMDIRKALDSDPMWGPLDPDRTFDYNDRVRTIIVSMATKDKNEPSALRDKGGSIASPTSRTVSSCNGLKN